MPTKTKTSKKSAPKTPKKLTIRELQQFLQTSSAAQTAIHAEITARNKEDTDKEVDRAKKYLEFYYKLKGELQDDCLAKLQRLQGGGHALLHQYKDPDSLSSTGKWSKSKILKIIAGLPARKPDTDSGIVKAVRTIEYGKPRKWSRAVKEKRKLAAEEKKKKATQATARGEMFKQKESDKRQAKKASAKKKPTTKKISRPKPKSAGAMAVGDDGLTKHQRYETKRVMTPDQVEAKNEARRQRRAAGQSG